MKCKGLLGLIFGHKWYWARPLSEYTYPSDHCTRCGMFPGRAS